MEAEVTEWVLRAFAHTMRVLNEERLKEDRRVVGKSRQAVLIATIPPGHHHRSMTDLNPSKRSAPPSLRPDGSGSQAACALIYEVVVCIDGRSSVHVKFSANKRLRGKTLGFSQPRREGSVVLGMVRIRIFSCRT